MEMKDKNLTQEESQQIIGGDTDQHEVQTEMICDTCRLGMSWKGNYLNNIVYDCPYCKGHAFHGVRLL